MRVAVVAEYYPRRRDPVLGTWAHRQALATRDAGVEVRSFVLERPVPPVATTGAALRGSPRPLVSWLRAAARQPRHDRLDGLEVEYVRFLAPPRSRAYSRWGASARRPLTRALERAHADRPLDLVHAHYAVPAGHAARDFAARRGLPLTVSVHGGDVLGPALASPPARAVVAGVLREAASVLCNSRSTLARVAELTGAAEQLRVVHLGADVPAGTGRRRREPTVVTLGHLVARKRHGDVLRAVSQLAGRHPELRYLVIGDGPEMRSLRALAGDLGVADRVEWAGQLAPDAALRELARCHVMAMPSVDEAFGVAYVEALACGVPAIGCAGEGGPEEIAAVGSGMTLVPPAEPDRLAAAIDDLLADPEGLRFASVAARETAVRHFSWRACGEATARAYADALAAA